MMQICNCMISEIKVWNKIFNLSTVVVKYLYKCEGSHRGDHIFTECVKIHTYTDIKVVRHLEYPLRIPFGMPSLRQP